MIRLLYSLIPMALMVLLAFTAFALTKLSKKVPEYEAEIAAAHTDSVPEETDIAAKDEKEVTKKGYTVVRK